MAASSMERVVSERQNDGRRLSNTWADSHILNNKGGLPRQQPMMRSSLSSLEVEASGRRPQKKHRCHWSWSGWRRVTRSTKGRRMRRPASKGSPPVALALALTTLLSLPGRGMAWKDCEISPADKWKPATVETPALKILRDIQRRYTCIDEQAATVAASFYFDSACMPDRFFYPPDVHSCLEGRRVIFLGDSLSNQQGDSLLAMLGWYPDWMRLGDPRNPKSMVDEDGTKYFTLIDCWHAKGGIGNVERCYDYYSSQFRPPREAALDLRPPPPPMPKPSLDPHPGEDDNEAKKPFIHGRVNAEPSSDNKNRRKRRLRRRRALDEESDEPGGMEVELQEEGVDDHGSDEPGEWEMELQEEGVEDDSDEPKDRVVEFPEDGVGEEEEGKEFSVHMRMSAAPHSPNWFARAVHEFNGTRPSDIFVVNFGAHYHDDREGDEMFRNDIPAILDEMAEFGKDATMVWREISPIHFPAENGSYEAYMDQTDRTGHECCTGVPEKALERNSMVENYLKDNGLTDRVKLLRVYDMSVPRGAAHHTCNLAPPSTMDQSKARSDTCMIQGAIDCRHWSESGVVEEWNALLLNHVCSSPSAG